MLHEILSNKHKGIGIKTGGSLEQVGLPGKPEAENNLAGKDTPGIIFDRAKKAHDAYEYGKKGMELYDAVKKPKVQDLDALAADWEKYDKEHGIKPHDTADNNGKVEDHNKQPGGSTMDTIRQTDIGRSGVESTGAGAGSSTPPPPAPTGGGGVACPCPHR